MPYNIGDRVVIAATGAETTVTDSFVGPITNKTVYKVADDPSDSGYYETSLLPAPVTQDAA